MKTTASALLLVLLLGAGLCALPLSSRAAGGTSVAFLEDAEPQFKNDPALLDYVKKTLDYEPIGWSRFPSRSFNNPVGDYVLPFGFRAKAKGTPGPYTFLLIIEQNGNNVSVTVSSLKDTKTAAPAAPAPTPTQP
ncbi:MAG TPA: hypothetical protein VIM58_08400 [Candidatus Methylacidiphilales bacterium]